MSSPITIRGRQYQWEVHDEKLPGEGPTYVITGKRGHKWWTCRNKPNPDLMFLLPDKGFSKTMDRVWLTDSTGNLEVYSE